MEKIYLLKIDKEIKASIYKVAKEANMLDVTFKATMSKEHGSILVVDLTIIPERIRKKYLTDQGCPPTVSSGKRFPEYTGTLHYSGRNLRAGPSL